MPDLAVYSAIGGGIGAGIMVGAKIAYDKIFNGKSNGKHTKPSEVCLAHDGLCEKLTEIAESSNETVIKLYEVRESIVEITREFKDFKLEVYKYYEQKKGG